MTLLSKSAAAAKSLQSCPTLWDPTDGSPPGSPIPGILQARTLEWVAISFSWPELWMPLSAEKLFSFSCSVVFDSLWPHGLQPARFLCPWDFPAKNTGVGFHFLLRGIFLTQESNLGVLHCRQILYLLNYEEILAASKLNQKLGNRAHHPQYNLFSCCNLMFF